jgi:hypothetical protein
LLLLLGVSPLFVNPNIEKGEPKHHQLTQGPNKSVQNSAPIIETQSHQPKYAIVSESVEQLEKESKEKESVVENTQKHNKHTSVEVYGYMTLNELEERFKIPMSNLALCIGVPVEHADEKLGRLRKRYDFDMEDLRIYIEQNR